MELWHQGPHSQGAALPEASHHPGPMSLSLPKTAVVSSCEVSKCGDERSPRHPRAHRPSLSPTLSWGEVTGGNRAAI